MTKAEFDRISAAAHKAMSEPLKEIDLQPLTIKHGVILDEETFNLLDPFFAARIRHTYKFVVDKLEVSSECSMLKGYIKVDKEMIILPLENEYERYAFCVDLCRIVEILAGVYESIPFDKLYGTNMP